MHGQPHFYPLLEERINIGSHALGLALSVIGLGLLLARAYELGAAIHIVSVGVFGGSLVLLYTASTIYHSVTSTRSRMAMRTVDHASIYVLIAGTYTPFALLVLPDDVGWTVFTVVWGMAVVGILLKLLFTGRFDHLSTAIYVFMGWIIVFAMKSLVDNFSVEGLTWLVAGGIAYTVGALFYSIKKMPFSHATFHVFVLLGSFCHFVSIYAYILDQRVILL